MTTASKPQVAVATVGRKVWFYDSQGLGNIHDPKTPFDATVVYPYTPPANGTPQLVNLRVTDHSGITSTRGSVPLHDPGPDDCHGQGNGDFCTWMPYQVGQAKGNQHEPPAMPKASKKADGEQQA